MRIFLLVSIFILICSSVFSGIDGQNHHELKLYEADCSFLLSNGISFKQNCANALFSPSDFYLKSILGVFIANDLCEINSLGRSLAGKVGIVRRGSCPFDAKSKNGLKAGLKALIIINTDENEIFPMGSPDPSWNISIPVVMIANSAQMQRLTTSIEGGDLRITLRKEDSRKRVKSNTSLIDLIEKSFTTMTLLIVFTLLRLFWKFFNLKGWKSNIASQKENVWTMEEIFGIVLICFIFIVSRLATFRLISNPHTRKTEFFNYYHTETDEAIFETLIAAVNEDFWNYSLQSSNIINTFQLAKENYDFPIFHHPPLFVYLSSCLHYTCSLPLPFIPVLYQIVVLMIIPLIVSLVLRNTALEHRISHISFRAMVVWLVCPITALCSQKLWIDNALVLTTTIGLYFFLRGFKWIDIALQDSSFTKLFMKSVIVGFLTFILPINTKITSIGMFPFMIVFTWWTVWKKFSLKTRKVDHSFVYVASLLSIGLLLGCILCAVPWTYYYHFMTGRLMPSAIPSKEMLEKYPYVAKAVNKPWCTYLLTLLRISPYHLIGLPFIVIGGIFTILKVLESYKRKEKISERNQFAVFADSPQLLLAIDLFCLCVLPFGYIGMLTLIGILGGGYQTRFILPILPASAIVSAIIIDWVGVRDHIGAGMFMSLLELILLTYMTCLMFYYGIIFSIYYADVDYSFWQILKSILFNAYPMTEVNKSTLSILNHFGLIT